MAANFDLNDPSSPLFHGPSQTALLLLDFQGFTIDLCHNGTAVASKAAELRKWALSQNITIIHSIINVHGSPPPHTKNITHINQRLAGIVNDQIASSEPAHIAPTNAALEHTVLKQPGVVSGLKSDGCAQLIAEKGIKSLIICGLSTSGAVLRTTCQATDDGFVVSVISDACADRTVELHETLMTSVLGSRAHLATTDEFVKEWEAVKREA